jgi:hypothetical protein
MAAVRLTRGLVPFMALDWVNTATLLTANKDITSEQYLDNMAKEDAPIGRFVSPNEL